jgi:hypothetical protein
MVRLGHRSSHRGLARPIRVLAPAATQADLTPALRWLLRGRTSAAYARQHHAGTAADLVGRYRQLAQRGVSIVFVSLPDLGGPDDVLRLAPVAAAFA